MEPDAVSPPHVAKNTAVSANELGISNRCDFKEDPPRPNNDCALFRLIGFTSNDKRIGSLKNCLRFHCDLKAIDLDIMEAPLFPRQDLLRILYRKAERLASNRNAAGSRLPDLVTAETISTPVVFPLFFSLYSFDGASVEKLPMSYYAHTILYSAHRRHLSHHLIAWQRRRRDGSATANVACQTRPLSSSKSFVGAPMSRCADYHSAAQPWIFSLCIFRLVRNQTHLSRPTHDPPALSRA